MSEDFLIEWLDHHIWRQIQAMMLDDAYFKLMGRARDSRESSTGNRGPHSGRIRYVADAGYPSLVR